MLLAVSLSAARTKKSLGFGSGLKTLALNWTTQGPPRRWLRARSLSEFTDPTARAGSTYTRRPACRIVTISLIPAVQQCATYHVADHRLSIAPIRMSVASQARDSVSVVPA